MGRFYTIQLYVIKFVSDFLWFSPDIPVSSSNKTVCHDITEWVDTSTGGLLVLGGIIHPVVSVSALPWFIRYVNY
jgi:hypothetical protein